MGGDFLGDEREHLGTHQAGAVGVICLHAGGRVFLGDNPHYWLARGASFLVPIVVIPAIFYTYQRWTHRPVLWVDIMTFAVAAFLSAAVFAGVLALPELGAGWNYLGMGLSVAMLAAYLLLTRFPLHNFLFRDPNTHRYGFDGRRRPQRKRRA